MKKFSIYQITDQSNLKDPETGFMASTFLYGIGSAVTAETVANWYQEGLYELVAFIDAEDLDDMFRVGNIGPVEQITRIGEPHSLSVGDIIVDEDDEIYVVAPAGFDKLNVEETV
jgi:hypothetical protein